VTVCLPSPEAGSGLRTQTHPPLSLNVRSGRITGGADRSV